MKERIIVNPRGANMNFGKRKKLINIILEDYVIRILDGNGDNLDQARVIVEKTLSTGVIVNGKITDEIQFYNFMKELVAEFGLKKRQVRFYVPDSLVIMRQIEFPINLKNKKEVLEYLSLEIGKSIHLPFKDPVFDVHYLPYEDSETTDQTLIATELRPAVLFAVQEEEILKYTQIFDDVMLQPIAADVSALGIYRYYQDLYPVNPENNYLFVELKATAVNLSIFSNNQMEFLRYQDLDLKLASWEKSEDQNEGIHWRYIEDLEFVQGIVSDEVIEIERIMNFYRFSLHQGEKQITNIIVLGDNPYKKEFYDEIVSRFETQVNLLNDFETKSNIIDSTFIPALGLAIQGGSVDDEA